MDHVAVEDLKVYLTTIISDVCPPPPLPLRGETEFTHGPNLMMLMTYSEVDVIF